MLARIVGLLCLLLTACSASGLDGLLFEGSELHPSLETVDVVEHPPRHVAADVLPGNPSVSTAGEFVEAITRSGSQGKLGATGVRAALYALYIEDKQLGFYGMEAESSAEADQREVLLREIWAFNINLGRARVHRGGDILVVVWNEGVSAACWESVNRVVADQLQSGQGR